MLELSGALERDNDIPKFTGKVSIIGGDFQKSLSWLGIDNRSLKPQVLGAYKLNSDVLMLPSYNIFSNFSLDINNNKNPPQPGKQGQSCRSQIISTSSKPSKRKRTSKW